MSRVSNQITLFKEKSNGRIFPVGCIPKTGFFNSDEYEKDYTIINLNNIEVKNAIVNASYFLTLDKTITKSQYDELIIACSKDDIHTRKLTHDECAEVITTVYRFIHDVLEVNEFTLTDDNGKNPRPHKWSEHGRIFIDQTLLNNKNNA